MWEQERYKTGGGSYLFFVARNIFLIKKFHRNAHFSFIAWKNIICYNAYMFTVENKLELRMKGNVIS